MVTYGFDKSVRLLNSSDFSPVFADAQFKAACPELLLLARRSSTGHARLGIVVAKKQVKLATQRNHLKRLIRESFRQQSALPAIDIVVLVRKVAADRDNKTLHQLLGRQWSKLASRAANIATESSP